MPRGQALIIDDSSTARIILARLLQKADLLTRGAASAEEGFRMLEAEPYDLIFLDHLLPGINGFEALDRLKSDPETAHIPVFMYTSQNAERYLEDAKAKGAAGVISKQVDRNQLLAMIEAILAGTGQQEPLLPLPTDAPDPVDEAINRRLTGRLATLEIAYEETHDELHQLKTSLATQQASQQEALERSYRRLRLFWIFSIICLVLVVIYFSLELSGIKQAVTSVNEQFSMIQDILAQLIGLDTGGRQ